MGRDTDTIETETNGEKEIETKVITENQLINMKLDAIIELLTTSEKIETK